MGKRKTPEGNGPTPRESSVSKRRRNPTALSKQSDDPLWQMLEEKIGGRDGLLAAALASSNPKAPILAELLADVAFAKNGTKDLARKAGLSAPEIVDMFRDRKWLETTLALHENLPDIVRGASDDAKPKMVPCVECKGTGKQESGAECWVCGGWGETRKPGDKDKLQFVGNATGLINKGPLVQVNTQVNNMGGGSGPSFEDLMRKAVVKVGQKQLPATEAEVVDEHSDPED